MNWTADVVLAIISGGLSLAFAYLPFLKEWYDGLDSRIKPLIQLVLITVLVFGRLAVSCQFQWPCIQGGLSEAAALWLACLTANNITYQTAVKQFKQAEFDWVADYDPERK